MISYDSPVSVNGKGPSTTTLKTMPNPPMVMHLSAPSLPNGVCTHNATAPVVPPAKDLHIWLVTGPAGCGKSTVAKHLADSLHWPYIEGDEVCPAPVAPALADLAATNPLPRSTIPRPTLTR